jgi:hypothetical protein
MHTRRFERIALATFCVAACVAFFAAFITIEHAHAADANPTPRIQGTNPTPSAPAPFVNPAHSMTSPTFNPSSPNTVPFSRETPVSPASPGSIFGSGPSAAVN